MGIPVGLGKIIVLKKEELELELCACMPGRKVDLMLPGLIISGLDLLFLQDVLINFDPERVVDVFIFVINYPDDDRISLSNGEVCRVSFGFSTWAKKIEFSELLALFWGGNNVNHHKERCYDGYDKNDS